MNEFWEYMLQLGANFGLKILLGLILLIVGLKLAKLIVKMVKKGKGFNKIDKGVQGFIVSFIKIILYSLVIASAAMCMGVPGTAFLTIFTSAGVAIGLALQGSLSNFAGGIMILIFHPYKVGDFIESDGAVGTVTDITVIYTILNTPDNKVITVPNGKLTNANITNYSQMPERRVDIDVHASYQADVEFVKETLLEVARGQEKILSTPEPVVRLKENGTSALVYTYRVWCKGADYWDVYFDSMESIKKAFNEKGIEIPYTKVDVKLIQN